jgi:endoribonuclease LACTB2
LAILTPVPAHTIVNVGYRSTNFWVISAGRSRLLVDLGWPGTMDTMRANLARVGVPMNELRFGVATHYHIDHAGLAQEFKQAGVPLLVLDVQEAYVPRLREHIKPSDHFTDIALHDNTVITVGESRAWLDALGFAGEIVHTPGHSNDSVSIVLDTGEAFTGDLTHPQLITEEEAVVTRASWQLLRDRGARTVYAGHGPIRPMHEGSA